MDKGDYLDEKWFTDDRLTQSRSGSHEYYQ